MRLVGNAVALGEHYNERKPKMVNFLKLRRKNLKKNRLLPDNETSGVK
jgi:Fe-S-cluster formation regulator IscX/YfhJ